MLDNPVFRSLVRPEPNDQSNITTLNVNVPSLPQIIEEAGNGQAGDARLFSLLKSARFLYDFTAKRWLQYEGGKWIYDEIHQSRRELGDSLKQVYASIIQLLNVEIDADISTGAIQSKDLKGDPRYKAVTLLRKRITYLNRRRYLDDALNLAADLLPVTTSKFDQNEHLLNLPNGTYDLKRFWFREHNPIDLCAKRANAIYDSAACCSKWNTFVEKILCGDAELIRFVKQVLGLALTGSVDHDAVIFFYGDGRNGKSTFFNVLERIWGDYFLKLDIENLLAQPRGGRDQSADYAKTLMLGSRLTFASEIPEGRRLNEALVKDLSGGDLVNARAPYGLPFTFRPTHKLFLCGNAKPEIRGQDEGIWRRIHLIPFNHQFPRSGEPGNRPREEVEAELSGEASGILNWLIEGLRDLRESGLKVPSMVKVASNEYRGENDLLAAFIEERCDVTKGMRCLFSDFKTAYRSYCDGERRKPLSPYALNRQLTAKGFPIEAGTGNKKYILNIRVF